MLDHLFVSRGMLARYNGAKIHNELLHDESIAFSADKKFPESDLCSGGCKSSAFPAFFGALLLSFFSNTHFAMV